MVRVLLPQTCSCTWSLSRPSELGGHRGASDETGVCSHLFVPPGGSCLAVPLLRTFAVHTGSSGSGKGVPEGRQGTDPASLGVPGQQLSGWQVAWLPTLGHTTQAPPACTARTETSMREAASQVDITYWETPQPMEPHWAVLPSSAPAGGCRQALVAALEAGSWAILVPFS